MDAEIFDINRFAIHDGRGIRSTLFLKGCPMECPWCQNPEGKKKDLELRHFKNNCIGCGICVATCPQKALSMAADGIKIDRRLCRRCGRCVESCPALALRFDGRLINNWEAVEELLADTIFYEITGGGITLSGGEPTLHTDFCLELLSECKKRGINTAIETCLYTAPENLLKLAAVVDTFYADIKIFDPDKHKQIIGVSNSIILENFKMLAERGSRLVARIPLIPGFTADVDNIGCIGSFISEIDKNIPVELINYNPLAENKYAVFELEYPIGKGTIPYQQTEMDFFKSILKSCGINTVL